MIVIDKVSPKGKISNIVVDQMKLMEVLKWLKQNNKFFHDIELNDSTPVDNLETDEDVQTIRDAENLYDSTLLIDKKHYEIVTKKFKNYLKNFKGKRLTINHEMNQGISPLRTPGYLQKAFPEIFPYGEMDLDNTNRSIPIDLVKFIPHILKQSNMRFCQHPKLPYVG